MRGLEGICVRNLLGLSLFRFFPLGASSLRPQPLLAALVGAARVGGGLPSRQAGSPQPWGFSRPGCGAGGRSRALDVR